MEKVSKKNESLISIIIPVYKVEQYLDKCIESVVNQTYKNLEIILVDDGSPDACPQKCDDWKKKDKRIIVIHKENGGVSSARNEGIAKAKGDWITFVDSDDMIDKKMIERMVYYSKKENSNFITCDYIKFSKSDNISYKETKPNKISIPSKSQFMKRYFRIGTQECLYYPWGKLIKKELLEKDQFPLDCRIGEDVIGIYKILLKIDKIVELRSPYYLYFENPNSLTNSKFSDKDMDLINVWDKMVELTPKDNLDYLKYARFNRMRIDYTLLMRMAKNLTMNEIRNKYPEYKKMLSNLKKNKKKLIKSKIPLSRKISLLLICLNYEMLVNLLTLIRKEK